jgi:hypothetical protein
MTSQTYVLLIALIVFIALEFLLLAFAMFAWKHKDDEPKPPPVDFVWPDRVQLEYTNAAGETVANKFYIPE